MTTAQITKVIDISNIYNTNKMREEKEAELALAAEEGKKVQAIEITDKTSFQKVHDMQMKLLKLRTGIANDRKDFTKHLDEKKAAAIEIEKSLIGMIAPTEEALKAKKEAYEAEQERIKEEKKAEAARILQGRIDKLNAINAEYNIAQVAEMTDDGFDMLYDMHKKRFDKAEEERIAREAKENRINSRKTTLLQIGMYETGWDYTHDLVTVKVTAWDIENAEDEEFAQRVSIIKTQVETERENIRKQREENDRIARENDEKAKELKDKEDALKKQAEEQKPAPAPISRTGYAQTLEKDPSPGIMSVENAFGGFDQGKYNEWLAANGYESGTGEFYIETLGSEVILWKKISVFNL